MPSKKIVFVEPAGARSNFFSKFMNIPLLGPVYLATMAKREGYDVSIFNENILKRPIESDELAEADVLCVSCITTTVERGIQIGDRYRSVRAIKGRRSKAVIGGIHASMLPEDVSKWFDQVVIGEAENVFLDIISGKINTHIVTGERCTDLDSLPYPDFSLIRGWNWKGHIPIMTSRGCPFDCSFCSVTKMFGRNYRAQSPARVLREIERLPQGFSFFVDDNFAANMDRTSEILDGMIAMKKKRQWSAQVRTEAARNGDFVAKMKKAGCYIVHVGFESVDERSLLSMNKRQTVEDINHSIATFHDNKIRVHGMFILGNDTELKDIFKSTSDFAQKSRLDSVQFAALTPLPGTELFSRIAKEGRLLHKQWSFYDGLHVVHCPKNMTPNELQIGMIRCFKDFYSYSRAARLAMEMIYKKIISLLVLLTGGKRRTFSPSMLIKIVGAIIIKNWMRENAIYLSYVKRAALKA